MKPDSSLTNGGDSGGGAGGAAPRRRGSPLALIVTSDDVAIEACRLELHGRGFSVAHAASGVAAVSAVRKAVPDVVVVDMQLADVPGREALRWLQSMPQVVSARFIALVSTAKDALADCALPTLPLRKPVSAAALARVLDAVAPARATPPALPAGKEV